MPSRKEIAARATAEHVRRAALRAADNPDRLDKAANIVRAGLQLGKLTHADLTGPIVQPLASPP